MSEPVRMTRWFSPERARVVLCRGTGLTVGDAARAVATLAGELASSDARRWAIRAARLDDFLVALAALLTTGRIPVLFSSADAVYRTMEGRYEGVLSADGTLPEGIAGVEVLAIPKAVPGAAAEGAFPAIGRVDPESVIELFTSGSTGVPKRIVKTVAVMDEEARMTAPGFGALINGTTLTTSVEPQHLYGLTFAVWLPVSLGVPFAAERVRFTEMLTGMEGPVSLITTPTFMRWLDETLEAPAIGFALSSGGRLLPGDLARFRLYSDAPVHEIYGSTETGAVATRSHGDVLEEAWRLLPGASLTAADDLWHLDSPIVPEGGLDLEDRLEMLGSEGFRLLGRRDRIAKIGEVRISLGEIERALASELGFEGRAFVVTTGGRESIGVVVSLEDSPGFERASTRAYRTRLSRLLEPLSLPRFWRTVPRWPYNAQGKLQTRVLMELFEDEHR